MIGPRMIGTRLNLDPDAIPVFYVNKQIWNKEYQDLIKKHTYGHIVCIVVDPREEVNLPNRYVEFTLDSPDRFDYFKEDIDKLL